LFRRWKKFLLKYEFMEFSSMRKMCEKEALESHKACGLGHEATKCHKQVDFTTPQVEIKVGIKMSVLRYFQQKD
jgi:hypothetical protein